MYGHGFSYLNALYYEQARKKLVFRMPLESDIEKKLNSEKALQLFHRLFDENMISGRLTRSQIPEQNNAYYLRRYGDPLDQWSFEELTEAFQQLIDIHFLPVSNDSDTSLKMHNLLIALAEKIETALQKNNFLRLAKRLTNHDLNSMGVPKEVQPPGKPTVEGLMTKMLLKFRQASDKMKSNRQATTEKSHRKKDKMRNQVLQDKNDILIAARSTTRDSTPQKNKETGKANSRLTTGSKR